MEWKVRWVENEGIKEMVVVVIDNPGGRCGSILPAGGGTGRPLL